MGFGFGAAKSLFGCIAVISLVTSLGRHDYNLPVFAFLYWAFDVVPDERKWRQYKYMMGFVFLSVIQDTAYLMYWCPRLLSDDWQSLDPHASDLQPLVMTLSAVILVLKVIALAILFYPEFGRWCRFKVEEDVYEQYEVIKYHRVPPSKA